jgi:energy-coupling factor transporter ATP-binding protein EcfA2
MRESLHISSIGEVNSLLRKAEISGVPPVLCLLTGSSGCGKTYLCKELATQLDSERAAVAYFDSIGVPSEKEMKGGWGSAEKWQEAMTHEWIERISGWTDKALVVLEGSYHPRFVLEACSKLGIEDYVLAVVSCSEEVWIRRLQGPREQPELVTPDMRNWARELRDRTVELGGSIIDTSESDVSKNVKDIGELMKPMLQRRAMR